jgi:hypothetical protein
LRQVSSSHMTRPKEYTSALKVMDRLDMTSGAAARGWVCLDTEICTGGGRVAR